MKQSTIQIRCDGDQLAALRLFMEQKGLDLEAELEAHIGQLFEKYVNRYVKEYLLSKYAQGAENG